MMKVEERSPAGKCHRLHDFALRQLWMNKEREKKKLMEVSVWSCSVERFDWSIFRFDKSENFFFKCIGEHEEVVKEFFKRT